VGLPAQKSVISLQVSTDSATPRALMRCAGAYPALLLSGYTRRARGNKMQYYAGSHRNIERQEAYPLRLWRARRGSIGEVWSLDNHVETRNTIGLACWYVYCRSEDTQKGCFVLPVLSIGRKRADDANNIVC
jgi:hypothetical protein